MPTTFARVLGAIALFATTLLAGCGGGGGGGSDTVATQYTIGGTVSGLASGQSLALQDTGSGTTINISSNGTYASTPVPNGTNYNLVVVTQPSTQICSVTNGQGTVSGANVTNVIVSCANAYTVGGTVSGLGTGESVTLKNGTDTKTVASNTTFTFGSRVATGSSYAVTVSASPSGKTCVISNPNGTVVSSNITDISVACSANPTYFNIGAKVTGLLSGTLVLQNGTDTLNFTANITKNFATTVASGSAYSVTVKTQPTGQNCTVSSGSGTVGSANVTINVACSPRTYSVGGSVTGLGSSNTVTLLNNGTNSTPVSQNTTFTFSTQIAYGSTYSVTVSAQPSGQTCVVSNGSGTMAAANVANVAVTCSTNPTYVNINAAVTGLTSGSLVLQSGSDTLTYTSNVTQTFATTVASGSTYNVTVKTQPTGLTCTSSNSSGTVGSTSVTVNFACVANSGSGLCSTGVTTSANVAYTALAKPAKGVAVTDPDFGTTIRRITDASGDWGSAVAVPAYPTIQAWNSDETLMILYVTDGSHQGHALLNGKTYAFIRWLDINPADVEQFYWSTSNAHELFYVNNTTGHNQLTKVTFSTDGSSDTQTVVHDFANDMGTGGALHSCANSAVDVSGGEDPFYMSYDNDLFGLACYRGIDGPNGGKAYYAFSYRISTNTIGALKSAEGNVPQALPSGTGTYYYPGDTSVQVLNATTNSVTRTVAFNGSEHSDMLKGSSGNDMVAGVQFDGPSGSGTLMVANLSQGGVTTIIGPAKGDPYPPGGTLVAGKSWQNPGWVGVAVTGCPAGTNGNCNNATPVAAASPTTYLDQEIILANVDTGGICRVAHHRTAGNYGNAKYSNYWAQPNLVVSPSGTRILFASDWEGGTGDPKNVVMPTSNSAPVVDTYVIELPGYH